jgi:hypothetical protein
VGTVTAYPEIGFMVTDHIGVAVQGRLEYIRPEGSGDPNQGAPAKGAVAVLGRGLYYLDIGSGNAQIQISVEGGGGDGYRFAYAPTNPTHQTEVVMDSQGHPVLDSNGEPVTKLKPTVLTDTTRSGPLLYGGGVGFIYHFTHWVAANIELRCLMAGPHFGFMTEGYGSLQFSFGGRRPAQAGDAPPTERVIDDEEEE